jgi:hypothetical protein
VKDERSHLKYLEYGGRPLCYFNSKYVDEGGCGNWMGEEDLLCATDEQLNDSLDRIAAVAAEYKKVVDGDAVAFSDLLKRNGVMTEIIP